MPMPENRRLLASFLASLRPSHGSRRPRVIAGAMVVLGIAGLAAAMVAHANLDPDESQHLHAAWLIAQGRVPYADFWEHHMPLLPYALAPVTRWFAERPEVYFAGRAIMGLTAAATLGLVYVLGRRFGSRVGAAAVILLAVQFRFLQHSIQVRPDGPALLTWLATVLMLVRWRERELAGRLWVAGLWLGLTAALTPKAAFVGLGAAVVVLASPCTPSPTLPRMLRRIACLGIGCAVPLVALLAWLAGTGGSAALRHFVQDVVVANLRFPDFIKQTAVGGEGVGFVLLGLAGVVMTIRRCGRRVLQHPVHGPLLIPPAVVSGILLLPSTPAVYSYTWLPVIASGSLYAGQALVAAVKRARPGAGTRWTALLALVVVSTLVVPVIVVGVLAFPPNRDNEADFRRMSLELAYACPGEAVLDGPPLGVFDSRLQIDGPVSAFIEKYYLREPDGLLVAGAGVPLPGGAGETDVDLLVPGRYEVAITPGVRVMIDGAVSAPSVTWLSGGRHRISWSGVAGTLRLAIVPCAQRWPEAPPRPAPSDRAEAVLG